MLVESPLQSKTPNGEQGFSILEVVVAMTIFLGITASIWGLMQVGLQSRTTVNETVQLTKSVRVSLNQIGRDTYNAGLGYPVEATVVVPNNRISNLLGLPPDSDNTRDTVPPIISGNNITVNTFNTTAGVRTDQVTFLFRDTGFNLLGNAGPPDRRIPQPLMVNFAPPDVAFTEIISINGSNTACAENDLYLISGGNAARLGLATGLVGSDRIRFGNGDVLGLNLAGSPLSVEGVSTPAGIQKVNLVTYHVTPDGTLMRRRYVNAPPVVPAVGWVDQPLVYGVENFQIQYVMNNGQLSDNPVAGPDGIIGTADDGEANLSLIRQVRYTISVRSVEPDRNGRFYRETMTSTFSTRNLGYDAS